MPDVYCKPQYIYCLVCPGYFKIWNKEFTSIYLPICLCVLIKCFYSIKHIHFCSGWPSGREHHDTDVYLSQILLKKTLIKFFVGCRPALKRAFDHLCTAKQYVFTIQKCAQAGKGCEICSNPTLPAAVFGQLHPVPDPVPGEIFVF